MRSRSLVGLGAVVALALTLGWILSLATTRVKNWFVMSDELYYERLAISIAQSGSLLPRLHGEVVSNLNQLYPLLLSTLYGSGDVPASLEDAHRLNAFAIATAAIPVYLLARRVGIGLLLAVAVGGLAVAVPWIVLSSFLLTEVVAYPAFCWALLALVHAVERKTWVWDAVALVAIGVAVLARTQFLVLLAVLPAAVFADAALTKSVPALWRTRRPLILLYSALAVVVLGAALTGDGSRLLGSYSVTAENVRVDVDLLQLTLAHVAAIALGLALLPFVVGMGWIVDRIRPTLRPRSAHSRSSARRRLSCSPCRSPPSRSGSARGSSRTGTSSTSRRSCSWRSRPRSARAAGRAGGRSPCRRPSRRSASRGSR